MDNSSITPHPGDHSQNQGQQVNDQAQMNHVEQIQNFQALQLQNLLNNNIAMNMLNQHLGRQMTVMNNLSLPNQSRPVPGVDDNIIPSQQTNGDKIQRNQIFWQQQQSQNRPLGASQGMNTISSMSNNELMSTMPSVGIYQPALGGCTQNSNNRGPISLNQQQAHAELYWNALRSSQGQLGNQGAQNALPCGGNTDYNMPMGNMQLTNTDHQRVTTDNTQSQMATQLQVMQHMQSLAGSSTEDAPIFNDQINGEVSVPLTDSHGLQPFIVQIRQENSESTTRDNVNVPRSPLYPDQALSQLFNPDPIVTDGNVHAASFQVMTTPPVENILHVEKIEGKITDFRVQGICIQGGNARANEIFLKGNFAGGWQSNMDLPERERIIISIIKIIEQMQPNGCRLSHQLPYMAKKLEEHLYRSAQTREEYLDSLSLKRRIHLIAKGVGVPKPKSHYVTSTSLHNQMIQNTPPHIGQSTIVQPPNYKPMKVEKSIQNIDEDRTEKMKHVIRQQQQRLMLLRHSKLCDAGEDCPRKFCSQMVVLWKHLKLCKMKNCPVPHCVSSRCVLSHHHQCKRKNHSDSCDICSPLNELIRKSEGTDGESDDWNDDWNNFSLFEAGGKKGSLIFAKGDAASINSSNGLRGLSGLVFHPQDSQGDRHALVKELQKNQALLTQIRSQKRTLSNENTHLLEKLPASQDRETSAHIKNQINLQRSLNTQLESHESFLRTVVNHQAHLIQKMNVIIPMIPQISPNYPDQKCTKQQKQKPQESTKVKANEKSINSMPSLTNLSAAQQKLALMSPTCKKRSAPQKNDDTRESRESQLRKSFKQDPLGEGRGACRSETVSGHDSKYQLVDKNALNTTGILSSMTIAAIEKHLDSLVSSRPLSPRCISRIFLSLVRKLLKNEHGWIFKDPVDPIELNLESYFEVVKNPMDLSTVEEKLNNFGYKDVKSVEHDVNLVFNNAILFNGEDSEIGEWARQLRDTFKNELQILMSGLGIVSKEDAIAACKYDTNCSLCGNCRLLYEPPVLFCSGDCGIQKINRNRFYYADKDEQNFWCDRCYQDLNEEMSIQLDYDKHTKKSLLIKLKNDLIPEEKWVQCDFCEEWCHQICALFNGSRKHASNTFACPKCVISKHKTHPNNRYVDPVTSYRDASNLPECTLSRVIEEGLSQTLSEEYKRIAKERACDVSDVEKVEDLCVRVVMSSEKKHKVREGMLSRYSSEGFPSEFPVTSKCILLFQKIHDIDVLLFVMYVYEYGDKCPSPNRRRVYISYLDSVQYLEPSVHRTITYHTIICEYLRYVRARGFHTAHIWSCPPSKGDEYIFHCHPPQQLILKDDMLHAWYVKALKKAQDEGVVVETRTIYDDYFKDKRLNPKTGKPFDPTNLPYFEGDYIPGEIEKIINIMDKNEGQHKGPKPSDPHEKTNPSKSQKIECKRKGTRSNPDEVVHEDSDKVMSNLGLAMRKMKQNFFVVQLLSDDFVNAVELGVDVSAWVEDNDFTLLMERPNKFGKTPDLLHVQSDGSISNIPKVGQVLNSQVVGNIINEEPSIGQECFDTRIAFLNFCQKNYLQFDDLRRAKYSTMLLLNELHDQKQKEYQLNTSLQVIAHATSCDGCDSKNCKLMKELFSHVKKCEARYHNGCRVCCRLFVLLTKHARACDEEFGICDIPFCDRIRQKQQRLLKQQQVSDDRRRDDQNNRHEKDATSCKS